MITLEKKKNILSKICRSKTFSNAPTSIALLKYLFEATVNNTDLKESIIELDFFGEKNTSKKDSPKVRVNVYNLRKKLDSYYAEEGSNDDIKLFIDKGQYLVRFEKIHRKWLEKSKGDFPKLIPYFIIGVLLIVIVVRSIESRTPEIWKDFLSEKKKTTLFVGDAFGMLGNTVTGRMGWTRDYQINNLDEFYQFLDANPKLKDSLMPPSYAYTTQMGVLSAKRLQMLFSKYNMDFDVRFSSKTSIADVKAGNAIYVGPVKNDNPFIDFFSQANPYFNLKDSVLTLSNHPDIKDTTFVLPYRIMDEELAIVSKIPGPDNTVQFLFFANHDVGVSSTFQYFMNRDSLEHFNQKYLGKNNYFTALFKAKGLERTDTKLEEVLVVSF